MLFLVWISFGIVFFHAHYLGVSAVFTHLREFILYSIPSCGKDQIEHQKTSDVIVILYHGDIIVLCRISSNSGTSGSLL